MANLNIDRIGTIVSITISIGAVLFAVLKERNSLEFMTKEDFNTFQVTNVQKMTSLEAAISNGFTQVGQQISGLQFVTTKEYVEYKERVTESSYALKKEIEFLKRDIELIQKELDKK